MCSRGVTQGSSSFDSLPCSPGYGQGIAAERGLAVGCVLVVLMTLLTPTTPLSRSCA